MSRALSMGLVDGMAVFRSSWLSDDLASGHTMLTGKSLWDDLLNEFSFYQAALK